MAHKVKLHLCLAVGSYFKHGGACSSSPSTFRTGIALYEAHSSAYYFLTAAVLPDQLEKCKLTCYKIPIGMNIEVVDSAMNAVKQHVRLGQHITKLAIFITLVEVLWNSR